MYGTLGLRRKLVPVIDQEALTQEQLETLRQAEAAGVNLSRLPKHVAVIMDGNGRWAKSMKRPRIEGHRAGIKSVREIVRTCRLLEIPLSDALRLFRGKLEASQYGNQCTHDSSVLLPAP